MKPEETVKCNICEKECEKQEMLYCFFDRDYICPSCCGHCCYNNNGVCIWPAH